MAMSFYFLIPTLPKYVIEVLGEDKSKVGLIIGFYAFSALAIRPISGFLIDKYGRKYLYLGSLLLFSLIMASYNVAYTFFILLVIRLFHGATWGVLTTGGSTIAADIIPEKKRGVGIGIFGLSFTLSMALGPAVGEWILQKFDFNVLFWSAFFVGILAFIMALNVNIPKISAGNQKVRIQNLFDNKVAPVALVMILLTFPFAGIMSFISLFSEEIGIPNGGAYFFLFYAIGVGVLRPVAGLVMDKKGPKLVIAACMILSFTGMIMIGLSGSAWVLYASAIITGLGNGLIMPVMQTMVINMVSPERRGVANSTLFSAIDLGFGLGSFLLGTIAEIYSLRTMFMVNALIIIIPTVYFFTYALKYYHKNLYQSSPE
jgi:MFS family permease